MPSEHTGTVQSGTPRYNLDTVAEYLPMEAVPDDADFAELLQALRVRAGLTVREVAERMGVSVGNVSQYLYRRRGRGGNGTLRWFLRFLEACDSSMILAIPPRRGHYAQQRTPTTDRSGSAGDRRWTRRNHLGLGSLHSVREDACAPETEAASGTA